MATAGAGGSGGTARDRSRAATLAVSVAALGVAGVASWWALTGSDGPADGEGVEGTSPVAGSGIDDLGPDSVPGIGSIEGVAEALAEAQRIRDAVRESDTISRVATPAARRSLRTQGAPPWETALQGPTSRLRRSRGAPAGPKRRPLPFSRRRRAVGPRVARPGRRRPPSGDSLR